MSSLHPIHEVRLALTAEAFDQAVYFYRDRLGLAVVEQWQRAEGRGVILALGPQTTLELFDAAQAAFVDAVEVGRRVSGPVRLALEVQDVEAATTFWQSCGAMVLSHPTLMPWGDRNARLETPDGMQVTLYEPAAQADKAAIIQTALDYIEGWYEGNAERMQRSLHPDLAKRIVRPDATTGRDRLDQMSALGLVQSTQRGGGTRTPPERQQKEVIILDRFEHAASVKVIASDWIDYLHLVKWNGAWVIVNVLWELKPESR
jgi:catechol 2,3-dioxygenase-like lactoylglutathione lyase family enzyme